MLFQPTTFLNFLLFFEYSCSNGLYYFQPTTFFKISFYSLNTHVQTLMFEYLHSNGLYYFQPTRLFCMFVIFEQVGIV